MGLDGSPEAKRAVISASIILRNNIRAPASLRHQKISFENKKTL